MPRRWALNRRGQALVGGRLCGSFRSLSEFLTPKILLSAKDLICSAIASAFAP